MQGKEKGSERGREEINLAASLHFSASSMLLLSCSFCFGLIRFPSYFSFCFLCFLYSLCSDEPSAPIRCFLSVVVLFCMFTMPCCTFSTIIDRKTETFRQIFDLKLLFCFQRHLVKVDFGRSSEKERNQNYSVGKTVSAHSK